MDWIDIALHALGAAGWAVLVWALCTKKLYEQYGFLFVVLFPAIFWIVREMGQHNGNPLASPQSILEWTVPVGVSFVLGMVLYAINEEEHG